MKPPEKSAGYSGADDLTTIILSSCDDGIISNENARWSASLEGTAAPFSHTLLYRCESPRTITNFSSMMLTPGMRRITSPASLSCVRLMCCSLTPVIVTCASFCSRVVDASVLWRSVELTVTSPSVVLFGSSTKSNTNSSPVTLTLSFIMVLQPMNRTVNV